MTTTRGLDSVNLTCDLQPDKSIRILVDAVSAVVLEPIVEQFVGGQFIFDVVYQTHQSHDVQRIIASHAATDGYRGAFQHRPRRLDPQLDARNRPQRQQTWHHQ